MRAAERSELVRQAGGSEVLARRPTRRPGNDRYDIVNPGRKNFLNFRLQFGRSILQFVTKQTLNRGGEVTSVEFSGG